MCMANNEIIRSKLISPNCYDPGNVTHNITYYQLQQAYDELKREFTEYKCSHNTARQNYIRELTTQNAELKESEAQNLELTKKVQILETTLTVQNSLILSQNSKPSKSNTIELKVLSELQATCTRLEKTVDKKNTQIYELKESNIRFPLDILRLTLELKEKEEIIDKYKSSLDSAKQELSLVQNNCKCGSLEKQKKSTLQNSSKITHVKVKSKTYLDISVNKNLKQVDENDYEFLPRNRCEVILNPPIELNTLL